MDLEGRMEAGKSGDSGSSDVTSKLAEVRDRLSDRLHAASDNIRKATGQEQNTIAQSIDGAADYLREIDPQKVGQDLREGVRRHPGRSLLIAGAAGLLLGIMVRR